MLLAGTAAGALSRAWLPLRTVNAGTFGRAGVDTRPGTVRVFGLDPRKAEVAVKSRIAYVPDYVAFYPWMKQVAALGAVVLPAVPSTAGTERVFPSRLRDARGARVGRPLRGATRTPTN